MIHVKWHGMSAVVLSTSRRDYGVTSSHHYSQPESFISRLKTSRQYTPPPSRVCHPYGACRLIGRKTSPILLQEPRTHVLTLEHPEGQSNDRVLLCCKQLGQRDVI
jgi:hypothetical protein